MRAGNGSRAAAPGPSPLCDWNDWIQCFTQDQVAFWSLSQLLWLIAHIMVIYFRCKQRLWKQESLFCVIYSFLGNMCNMFGALLAKQLSIQVFTAAYMAAVDILHFVLILFPVCGSRSKSELLRSRNRRRRRRRRRTAELIVCLPFVMGTSYYFWPSPIAQVDFHGPRRKLLTTLLQDGTEVIGYALGVTAIIIAWTSKLPLILKATRGKIDGSLQKCAIVFSMLASVLYTIAILSQEKTPHFILRTLPWLLIYLGGAALDISILYLLCLLKNKTARQQWGLEMVVESDTISLLEAPEQGVEKDKIQDNAQNTDWVPLSIPQNNRYLRKMMEIGHYMDLSIEPVQEIGFDVKRLPGDGQICSEKKSKVDTLFVHDPPMYPPKQVIHAKLSSCSSSDATSINSELEQKYLEALSSEQWDFEDMPQQWKTTERKRENVLSNNPGSQETIMSEERTSAILAQYEEEINRTGQRRKRSLFS